MELELAGEPDSVAACFEIDCNPQPVMGSEAGTWAVSQAPSYLLQDPEQPGTQMPGNVSTIRLLTVHRSGHSVAGVLAIHSEPAGGGRFWAACPGPSRYLPVQVP